MDRKIIYRWTISIVAVALITIAAVYMVYAAIKPSNTTSSQDTPDTTSKTDTSKVGVPKSGSTPSKDTPPTTKKEDAAKPKTATPTPPGSTPSKTPETPVVTPPTTPTNPTNPTTPTTPTGRSCPPLPAYPNANCTGVLPGVARTSMSGTTITQNGAVLENVNVSGRLTINASNVVIKNMKLTTNEYWGLMIYGQNITITDSTFVSTSADTQSVVAALGGSFHATRIDISGGPDGIQMGSNSSLTDSYIHDLNACPGCHNDTVNADDVVNTTIIHNTLLNQAGQTSVITAPNASILIKNNWIAGGGYAIYGGRAASPSGGIVITNNVFSRQFFPNVGYYGTAAYWSNEAGNSWTNNKYDNGTAVPSP